MEDGKGKIEDREKSNCCDYGFAVALPSAV
jgi:hypothetical protein